MLPHILYCLVIYYLVYNYKLSLQHKIHKNAEVNETICLIFTILTVTQIFFNFTFVTQIYNYKINKGYLLIQTGIGLLGIARGANETGESHGHSSWASCESTEWQDSKSPAELCRP